MRQKVNRTQDRPSQGRPAHPRPADPGKPGSGLNPSPGPWGRTQVKTDPGFGLDPSPGLKVGPKPDLTQGPDSNPSPGPGARPDPEVNPGSTRGQPGVSTPSSGPGDSRPAGLGWAGRPRGSPNLGLPPLWRVPPLLGDGPLPALHREKAQDGPRRLNPTLTLRVRVDPGQPPEVGQSDG